ncbi:MAG: amino acid adenylation domain-containing protein, partial [Mycobacteriaceae bacterium]|nr:amino acid adenylation domain-containing protein [Mycobacteriaceae bacterium]
RHAGAGGRPALAPRPRPAQVPLSLAQQRMWFHNRFDAGLAPPAADVSAGLPDVVAAGSAVPLAVDARAALGGGVGAAGSSDAINHIPIVVRFTGALDVAAMRAALRDVVERHEALRTVYPATDAGQGIQVVLPAAEARVDLPLVRATDLPAQLAEFIAAGFDVTAAVPVRARLFSEDGDTARRAGRAGGGHVLAVVVHHISGDGWSMRPLARDLMAAYLARAAGEAPAWAPLPVQYADYTLWQRALLGDEADPQSLIAQQVDYWSAALAGLPDQLDLPTDRPRPAVASYRGATHGFSIPARLHNRLVEFGHQQGASLFMVVQAALAALLSRLSGEPDIAVGTVVAGRGDAQLDDLVGMFVNTLVLRTAVDGAQSPRELLGAARETDLHAFANADVPFERLVEILNPARSQARHPLFQVMLSFQNTAGASVELPELAVSEVDLDAGVAKFDLQLDITPDGGSGLRASVNYATDLFDAATAAAFGQRLVRVLEAFASAPDTPVGEIDLLDSAERMRVLWEWNATGHHIRPATLVSLFEAQVERTPDATAVTFEGASLTYAEFSGWVNRLARNLIELGVGPESLVGVAMRRSVDMVAAVYAIQVAGGAYVPIDPDHPAERIAHILETAEPVCVLTAGSTVFTTDMVPVVDMTTCVGDLDATPVTDAERIAPLRPEHTAYVIFTSGSTGRPKGVAVSHAAIVNRLVWMHAEYGLAADDVVLQKTPVTFDVSVWELFWPLQVGARMVVARPDGHRDPAYLVDTIVEQGITTVHFVPSMLSVFVAELRAGECRTLQRVFASGEALPGAVAQRLRALLPEAGVHNLYGPTEAAVDVTFHEVTAADTVSVPIGAPVFNTQLYVLDERLRPAPVGVPGELYLAGAQLAREYVGRADLTADRFVANPFEESGERMYRTGDLVRWSAEGEVEYIGRTDFQVKLRGLRIELGEIEAALTDLPGVDQAVVLVRRDDERLGDRLVAYTVAPPGGTVDVAAVKDAVAQRVPSYMVPDAFVALAALPVNASGKLDRRALPAPEIEAAVFRGPETPVQQTVADVIADVLALERGVVGLDDEFFGLGGNSLLGMQVVARLGAALGISLAVRDLFEAPTVAALAVRAEQRAGGSAARPKLVVGPRPERLPLSPAQQRFWFLNQFDPTASAVDNIPFAVRLTGVLDVLALQAAISDVIERHEVLRTVYPEVDGTPQQVILPAAKVFGELAVTEVDEGGLVDAITEFASTTFDVAATAPLAVRLYSVRAVAGGAEAAEHVLAIVVHHVSADGASATPLARDLMTAYAARSAGVEPGWTALRVQYADYAIWQRVVLGDDTSPESEGARQVEYWKAALAGVPDQLELPSDRPRPATQSFRGDTLGFEIDSELRARLAAVAREHNASLFMVVHAALSVLLARLSGTEDIAVGTPVAGRGQAELDDMIGMFVNTLVLRTEVTAGTPFAELLAGVRERDLEAFAHADVPFERLVEVLNPARSTGRNPLFQVGLLFQNFTSPTVELPGLRVSLVEAKSQLAKTDLQVTVYDQAVLDPGGKRAGAGSAAAGPLTVDFGYATDLFDANTVAGFANRFIRLLHAVAADPTLTVDAIELLDASERATVLREWNDTRRPVRPGLLLDGYRRSVAEHPHAVAVVVEDQRLTYREFDARVNRLAHHLVSLGVGAEDRVALALGRGLDLLVGIYAVLTAGGAYVPLDPSHPVERNEYVLDVAAPKVVLTCERDGFSTQADVPLVAVDRVDVSGYPDTPPTLLRPVRPDNTAYTLFTSGSTGRPKGVAVSHGAIHNQLCWMLSDYPMSPRDVYLFKAAVTFDVSLWGLFSPLWAGATMVFVSADGARDTDYLADAVARHGVTVTDFVPSLLAVFAAHAPADKLGTLRTVFVIGEALPPETVAAFGRVSSAGVYNLYGPTEAAVSVTHWQAGPDDTSVVPIGRPEWNCQVYVLDSRLRPVPPGTPGELYLAGEQLARGYFTRPDLTSDRFVANPHGPAGSRMYRTGDLVRWRVEASTAGSVSDGVLIYIGRTDFQVKFRGQRIELGEIETALLALESVQQAAVLVRADGDGERLVGYVVPAAGHAPDGAQLRDAVGAALPGYMVPGVVMVLDEFPVNSSGKLDRKALPAPVFEAKEFRAPVTETERVVAELLTELLKVERVGLDDEFFGLGGDSIKSIQLVSRARARGLMFTARDVFEHPTVEALARAVQRLGAGGFAASADPLLDADPA